MNKKLLYGMLSGIFAVGMLAACGGAQDDGGTNGDDNGGDGQDNGGEMEDGGDQDEMNMEDDMEDDMEEGA